ncbi:co-chaperone YbbN [Spirosoma sp. KNUC1025]|uniref:thioredoxin family protein n=1 Tax=Spirosoma sp. KNUC1025 TaxID=2894082 RepID=UPI00386CA2E0|nr:thioredoxin domain-containing protein [Spirosoma sp. KNUC1025]
MPLHLTGAQVSDPPTAILLTFTSSKEQNEPLVALLDSLRNRYGTQLRFLRIDSEARADLAQSFGVRSTPALVLIRKGREVWWHHGLPDELALSQLARQYLHHIEAPPNAML